MRPVARQLVPCGIHKALVLRACDRAYAQLEPIDEDRMWRPLVFMTESGAHGERPPGDRRKTWVQHRRARVGHRAMIMRDRRAPPLCGRRSLWREASGDNG